MTDPAAEDLETVSENRWYRLAETDAGYGIWQVNRPSLDPVAVFDDDGDGYAAADAEFRRRTRQMRLFAQLPEVLARVVAVGLIAWFLMVALTAASFLTNDFGSASQVGIRGDVLEWASEGEQVAYALWLGALALMVTLWLLRRAREEPRVA